eukprot:3928276-Pleurochrysis_carterae.AAC.1
MGNTDARYHGRGDQELHSKWGLQCGNRSMDQQIRENSKGGRRNISGDLRGLKPGSKHNGRLYV